MKEKTKQIKMYIGLGILVMLIVFAIVAGASEIRQAPTQVPSPVMRVVVNRACDFVTISDVTTALCTDGSEWSVTETTVPKPVLGFGAQPVLAAEPIDPMQIIRDEVDAEATPAATLAAETMEAAITDARDQDQSISMNIRYSHYWPPLGGPNCSRFVGGVCISAMASGKPWDKYVDLAVACPPEWAFGTTVVLDGHTWSCLDRGGKIKYIEGIPWVDFLTPQAAYAYGTIVTVKVTH